MTTKPRYRVTGRLIGCEDCEAEAEHPPHDVSYPADPLIVKRLMEGERLDAEERGEIKTLTAGDIADDIPATSISSWLKRGVIERVGSRKRSRKKGVANG